MTEAQLAAKWTATRACVRAERAATRRTDPFREQADADARQAAVEAIYDVLALASEVTGGVVDETTRSALLNLARMTVDHLLRNSK